MNKRKQYFLYFKIKQKSQSRKNKILKNKEIFQYLKRFSWGHFILNFAKDKIVNCITDQEQFTIQETQQN